MKYTVIFVCFLCAFFYGGFQYGAEYGYQRGYQQASNWAGSIYYRDQHYGRFLLATDTFPYHNGDYFQFSTCESMDSAYAREEYEKLKRLLEQILPDSVTMQSDFVK